MKKLFTLLLVACCTMAKAQQITAVEYFYDTDPGIGHAASITLNTGAFDSTFNFSVTGLSSGVHLLNIRLKNSINVWSTTYQSGVLISNGPAGDPTIVNAEYFFDADPGFGNGRQLAVNKTSLDEVVNFDVSGLSPGAHTIYVRLKNSFATWGFAYQGTFIVSNGTAGAGQVRSLEYFSENDLGVGRNTVISLTSTATLDTTVSIPVPDNGSDSSVLGFRLSNQNGQMGNVALNTVSLCDLYKPVSGFRGARFGNAYAFSDSSLFNTSKQLRWSVDNIVDTSYNNSKIYNYTFPAGFVGAKTVEQFAGSGCRIDTSAFEIQMQGVEYITPQLALFGRDYVMQVFGGGLDSLTQLSLTFGSTTVTPSDITAYQGKMLSAIFDFHNIAPTHFTGEGDKYDLHIHFSSGRDTVLEQAVILNDLAACEIWGRRVGARLPDCAGIKEDDYSYITTTLSGPTDIRLGTWNYYTMHVTNGGQALVKETPAWLIIPANYDVEFDVNWNVAESLKDVTLDSLPLDYYQVIDTVIGGQHMQYKMYGLVPPFIEGGATWDINFKIRSSVVSQDKILYWVQKPMFGSGLRAAWNCAWDLAGYTPLGCFTGAYDYINGKAGFDASYHSDFSHGILRGALKDAKNFAWNLGGLATSCGGATKAAAKKVSAEVLAKITYWESKIVDRVATTRNNRGLANCGILDITKTGIANVLTHFGFDPNSLSGNNDYDAGLHYISNYGPQHYTVNFENKPTATANAQHVFITDTLRRDKFVFSSFKFEGYRIGDSVYSVPRLRSQLIQTTGTKYDKDMQVRFSASFDTLTGILRADYYSLEKDGVKIIPDTSLRGFLPPDTDGTSGSGSLQFSIYARDLGTLDTFSNKAFIYFDNNAPIATNSWLNTVDTTAPTGSIVKAIQFNDSTVQLVVQHNDAGSGFRYNEFFAKSATDTVFLNVGNAGADTVLFTGTPHETYQFFTRAVDNVGNTQKKDSVADITYTFTNAALPVHLLTFSAGKENTKVKLLWSTTNEINFSRYVVERSADGLSFSGIGTVVAKGGTLNNYYQLYDEHPLDKANYYRLKQVDKDGTFTYSRIIRIDFNKAFTLAVTPVPAHDYIIIDGAQNFNQVQLIDMSGRVVKQFNKPAVNTFNVAGMPAGIYLVRLVSDNATETLKMVKQ